MWKVLILVLAISFVYVDKGTQNAATVEINSGRIEGVYDFNNVTGHPFCSFKGIPYAEPPVGRLRFQPPEPIKRWENIRETKNDGSMCTQVTGGSEDCLFLNVYTPKLPNETSTSLLPVMVYAHGGIFLHGSSSSKQYGPQYFMDKNIVLVTFNYRLNVFGFLNAGVDSAPGNVGLKDQVTVLKWVEENISKFSGDPKKVTIAGHSAGGTSVMYLLQSNLAKGLFQQALSMSGTTLNSFALQRDPSFVVQSLAKLLNIESENMTQIVEHFKTIPADILFKTALQVRIKGDVQDKTAEQNFMPSLEKNSSNAFVTDYSFKLLENNQIGSHVPLMMGYVTEEARMFITDLKKYNIDLNFYAKEPEHLLPTSLNIAKNSDAGKTAIKKILEYYFDNNSVNNATQFARYESQNIFIRGIRKTAELLRKNLDIYFYVFSYESAIHNHSGVGHAEELKHLFYGFSDLEESENDKKMRNKMTILWTNFVKTGNPTPNKDPLLDNILWPLVSKTEKNLQFLNITESLNVQENPDQKCYMFWENMFEKLGTKPFFVW